VRIHVWLPVSAAALSAAGLSVAGVVPADKRLH
jgi:hypothetical protein